MADVIRLDQNRIFMSNAAHLYITPYVAGTDDQIGNITYDVVSIVGDTLSLQQEDNTVNTKEWEFGDTPLYETITLGKWSFEATCIDVQNTIMKEIFGWTQDTATTGVFAPTAYTDIYASIVVTFHDAEDPVVALPKVKLNSKLVVASLKTSVAEAQLKGSAYNGYISTTSSVTPISVVNVALFTTSVQFLNANSFNVGDLIVDTDETPSAKIYTVELSGTTKQISATPVNAAANTYYTNGLITYLSSAAGAIDVTTPATIPTNAYTECPLALIKANTNTRKHVYAKAASGGVAKDIIQEP